VARDATRVTPGILRNRMPNAALPTRFSHVGDRGGVRLAVAGSCLLLLTACSNAGEADPTSEAFTGPVSNDLIATPITDCSAGRIEPGDSIRISGFDFRPDAVVELRWTVEARQETGTWPAVTADEDGEFTETLKVAPDTAEVGDRLLITAEGPGEAGLMMLATEVDIADC
jgi:hypothetical protein